MKKIVILGAGDFGREVAWLIEGINKENPEYQILGYLDDDEKKAGEIYLDYQCLGPISMLTQFGEKENVCAVIANQSSSIREAIVSRFPAFSNWETLIHPAANIARTVKIGKGCIICAGVNISVDTVIGDFCMFNMSATVGHDCRIGSYVSVMSGSCICGHVTIADHAYLATNSSVLPFKKVGRNAKVGAGSVVLRSVKDETTVMGVPAVSIHF